MRKLSCLVVTSLLPAVCLLSTCLGPQIARARLEFIPAPGEGVLCAWALIGTAAEFGRRCRTGQDPEVQEELAHSLSRIESYVLANSDPPLTSADVDRFKREQLHIDAPEQLLCESEIGGLYSELAAKNASEIRFSTDALVQRPGVPTWGDCL